MLKSVSKVKPRSEVETKINIKTLLISISKEKFRTILKIGKNAGIISWGYFGMVGNLKETKAPFSYEDYFFVNIKLLYSRQALYKKNKLILKKKGKEIVVIRMF